MPVNPANLNVATPKKKNIGLRLEETLANKLSEIAKLEDITTTDIITGLITDFLEDKVVYNNYLEDKVNEIISIPYNPTAKRIAEENGLNLNKLSNPNHLYYKISEIIDTLYISISTECSLDNIGTYESIFIPNNLDVYDTYAKSYYGSINLHNGIEILIEPKVAEYWESIEEVAVDNTVKNVRYADYTGCMYILYYEVIKDKGLNIKLIDYYKAIEYCKTVNNDYLFNLITLIYNKLEEADNVAEVEEVAEKYNTGNIINLDTKEPVEVKPLKLVTINNQTVIKQHDKEITEELTALRKKNKELNKELDSIKEILIEYGYIASKLNIDNPTEIKEDDNV